MLVTCRYDEKLVNVYLRGVTLVSCAGKLRWMRGAEKSSGDGLKDEGGVVGVEKRQ